jgi:hypothetical protein
MRAAKALLVLLPLMMAGCDRAEDAAGAGTPSRGRYAGIGIYSPSELWAQQSAAKAPADSSTAKLSDDEAIVVSIDSKSGEIRQCGNNSGHCVSLSAWGQNAIQTPLKLLKHAEGVSVEALEPEVKSPAASKR